MWPERSLGGERYLLVNDDEAALVKLLFDLREELQSERRSSRPPTLRAIFSAGSQHFGVTKAGW